MEKYSNNSEAPEEEKPKNLDYHEQKRIASEKRKKETKLKRTEEQIAEREREIEQLNSSLADCGSDYVKAAELSDLLDKKNAELEALYEMWEELQ